MGQLNGNRIVNSLATDGHRGELIRFPLIVFIVSSSLFLHAVPLRKRCAYPLADSFSRIVSPFNHKIIKLGKFLKKEIKRKRKKKKMIDDYSKVLFACVWSDVMCGCASLFNTFR